MSGETRTNSLNSGIEDGSGYLRLGRNETFQFGDDSIQLVDQLALAGASEGFNQSAIVPKRPLLATIET